MPKVESRHLTCAAIESEYTVISAEVTEAINCTLCKAPQIKPDDPMLVIEYEPVEVNAAALASSNVQAYCQDGKPRRMQIQAKGVTAYPVRCYAKIFNYSIGGYIYKRDGLHFFIVPPTSKYAQLMYEMMMEAGKTPPYTIDEIRPLYYGARPTLNDARRKLGVKQLIPVDVADMSAEQVISEARIAYAGLHKVMREGDSTKSIAPVTFAEYLVNRDFFDRMSTQMYEDEMAEHSS